MRPRLPPNIPVSTQLAKSSAASSVDTVGLAVGPGRPREIGGRLSVRVGLGVLFASLLAPVAAQAAGRIGVLSPQIRPAPTAEAREKFHESLIKGLAKAGDLIPYTEVRSRLELTPELFNCASGACLANAAQLLGADKVVVADVEDVGKNYTIKLRFYDGVGHDLGSGPEERCEICSVREAQRSIEHAGERSSPLLAAVQGQAPPAAPARSAPVPAKTTTPSDEDEVPGGQARPSARTSAPAPAPAAVAPAPVAAAPAAAPVETAPPAAATTPGTSRFPYKPVAYAAFGVAAASLGATIAFGVYAAKENDITCVAGTSRTACPTVYKGNVAGAATFGVLTALAAGAGAALLYLDWKRPRNRPVVSAGPIPGGGFAGALSMDF